MKILGIDPGLRHTGWGIINLEAGSKLSYVASGDISPSPKLELPQRLVELHHGLLEVCQQYQPHACAIEKVFVNVNAKTTLQLGQARGVILMSVASFGIDIEEYEPNKIKKTVTGVGHAQKQQIQAMIKVLLPKADFNSADTADALATAICYAQHNIVYK